MKIVHVYADFGEIGLLAGGFTPASLKSAQVPESTQVDNS